MERQIIGSLTLPESNFDRPIVKEEVTTIVMNPIDEFQIMEAKFGSPHLSDSVNIIVIDDFETTIIEASLESLQSPTMRETLDYDLHIEPDRASILSRLNVEGCIINRIMIQRPENGNWVSIITEGGSNTILIQFLDIMEVLTFQL